MFYQTDIVEEKRKFERVAASDCIIKNVNGFLHQSVMIADVSVEGMRLIRVPNGFALNGRPTLITISRKLFSEHYDLTILPCWRRKKDIYWDVGFYIHNPSDSWKRFVRRKKILTE